MWHYDEACVEVKQSHEGIIFPSLSTVILCTPAELSHISSSVVRELLSFGRDVSEFLPAGVDINKYLK